VAVILVLAILSAVAIPRYLNYRSRAQKSADEAAIAGINTALQSRYVQNRANEATSALWITAASGVASTMETGALPQGITLTGSTFTDQRGNSYTFTAETATKPARLALTSGSGSGGAGGSGGGGTASIPTVLLALAMLPHAGRPRREAR
jgi:type II secretory pathway pseudopilin PulG